MGTMSLPFSSYSFFSGQAIAIIKVRGTILKLLKYAVFAVLLSTLGASPTLAQWENDDTYDPFADYSDYDATAEEEADINFFKTGRLFTMGLHAGYRNFTGDLQSYYGGGTSFGLFLSYFFDLRFALLFGFSTSSHALNIPTQQAITGNVDVSDIAVNLKYYMNTQNVSKGLAKLNPYLIVGMSQITKTYTVVGAASSFSKESANGFNLGAGIEIPAMRNKMYYGVQATYTPVNFPDENVAQQNPANTGPAVTMNGDPIQLLFILGVNF